MAKQKVTYKLPNPLVYRLNNPNFTIYHRAALGGLAATVRAWGKQTPEGVRAELQRDEVRLSWSNELLDQDVVSRILYASFRLTDDKLIDLPGQQVGIGQHDLRLAIHNGIAATFLQHPKMRPSEKEPRHFELKNPDEDAGTIFTYKAINSYAHQKAQSTGLFNDKLAGSLSDVAAIPQWIVPGATGGARDLQAQTDEALLLMFLMVGCAIFLLRPRTFKEKARACLVVPDVRDLVSFARGLERIAAVGWDMKRFSNTYLGRVVGGAEEAALKFLIDVQAEEVASERSVAGCLAVAMGKVAWDTNQVNRSIVARLKGDYPEMNVFRAANTYLGGSKIIRSNKGEGYAVPASPIPELVAANLAAERHWGANFKTLVSEKKDFDRLRYFQRGLRAMKESIKDADDQAIIRAFQEAWRLTMGAIGERSRREGLIFERLIEVERERMRNAILRSKSSDALAGWFLRFCADSTKGGSLAPLREDGGRIRNFIFNQRNFERFQNLCLFALVSYASDEAKSSAGGTN